MEVGRGNLTFGADGTLDSERARAAPDAGAVRKAVFVDTSDPVTLDFSQSVRNEEPLDGFGPDYVRTACIFQSANGYAPGGYDCVEPIPVGAVAACTQSPKATSLLVPEVNIDPGADVPQMVVTSVFDSLGITRAIALAFTKTAPTVFDVRVLSGTKVAAPELGRGVPHLRP